MKKDIWQELYFAAKMVLAPRKISPYIEAGGVAAALLTKNGNLRRRLHRHRLLTRNVRRAECHCQHDYKRRKSDRQDTCRFPKRICYSSLRGLSGIHDAVERRQW